MISRFDLEMLLEKVTKLPNVGRAPKPDRRYGSNMIDDSSELEKLLNEMTDSPLKTTVPPVKNYPGLYIGGSENPAEQLIGSQDNDPWDGSHPSEPLRPSDNSKVNGILDDIEKDFPSSVDVSPGGGEGEASMNMILDQILEHEKSIVHATGSPHYVKDIAPPAPTKLPGPQASAVRVKLKDPVIQNTVSEVLEVVGHPEKPHVVPTDFVVPDDKVLTDILGDPDLNYVERKVTKTNMDLILDRVIIHEKQGPAVLQGNTRPPITVKPRPETNPTPGEAGHVITTQNLNYIEPANALLDITDEVIEEDKQYPGPLTHDDDTLIPMNSVKEPIVPTVGGRLGLAQKYEPGSIHGHRVRRSVNNPGVRRRWASEEDIVSIWGVMIACLLIAGLGMGCVCLKARMCPDVGILVGV